MWTMDEELPLRSKRLGSGIVVSAFVSRAFGFEIKEITAEQLSDVNETKRENKCVKKEAAHQLLGSCMRESLKESPLCWVLEAWN